MIKSFPLLLAILVLSSCSSSQDVVQDGLFQKRKYVNKGWFVEMPVKKQADEKVAESFDGPPTPNTYLQPVELAFASLDHTDGTALALSPVIRTTASERGTESPKSRTPSWYGSTPPMITSLPIDTSAPKAYQGLDGMLMIMTMSLSILLPAALAYAGFAAARSRVADKTSLPAYFAFAAGIAALVALAML
jgi:hypothetical protein